MSGRFGHAPRVRWLASNWARDWLRRGPPAETAELLANRNSLRVFRLVLARKEPKT